ncbi:MAG: dTDP-glucose 4,6-dehydratase [Deltaproteobacteria bacterium]|nr:dTDP-glucose 4,6-dehydratase [Deltaproteobacteria bacterium]
MRFSEDFVDRARRALITGGAGFIGSNFTLYMRAKNPDARIVVLDKLTYAGNLENLAPIKRDANFSFIKGDINAFETVDSVMREDNIDTVVNFAAESHVDRSILGPRAFVETNVMGTFTLLEAARKNWLGGGASNDKRIFLHVSTDEVYGSLGETGYFTEETPYSPNSPYSASKAASDHLVRAYHHTYGLPVITTNCSNNYGPYQFPEKLIPLITINALTGKPLPVYGDGGNVRDWLHVEDHCAAIETALDRGKIGEVYNVGGRAERKNIDIVNLICGAVDAAVNSDKALRELYPFDGSRKKLITYVKDRPGHDRRYAIDCAKIEKELGWTPAVAFEDGVRATVDWYVKNRKWWERVMSGEYVKYYERQYGGRSARP